MYRNTCTAIVFFRKINGPIETCRGPIVPFGLFLTADTLHIKTTSPCSNPVRGEETPSRLAGKQDNLIPRLQGTRSCQQAAPRLLSYS